MNILLGNIGTIFSYILTWLGQIASSLLTNPIFIIIMAIIFFTSLINLLTGLISEKHAKSLAVELTGSTDELEYYRSLSDEEKEEYNKNHI